MAWTVDATSGKGLPQSVTEWNSLISTNGLSISAPDSIWLFQEAAGNFADSGPAAITLTKALTVAYQQAVAGWTAKSIGFTDNTVGNANSSAAGLPDLRTQSMAILLYQIINATPAGTREILDMGGAAEFRTRLTVTPRLSAVDNANVATGTVSPVGAVRPYMHVINAAASDYTTYTDQEKLTPTWGAGTSATKIIRIGGAGGTAPPPSANVIYGVGWYLTNGQIAALQVRRLMEALGFSPVFAINENRFTYNVVTTSSETFKAAERVPFTVTTASSETFKAAERVPFVVSTSSSETFKTAVRVRFTGVTSSSETFKAAERVAFSGASISSELFKAAERVPFSGASISSALFDESGVIIVQRLFTLSRQLPSAKLDASASMGWLDVWKANKANDGLEIEEDGSTVKAPV